MCAGTFNAVNTPVFSSVALTSVVTGICVVVDIVAAFGVLFAVVPIIVVITAVVGGNVVVVVVVVVVGHTDEIIVHALSFALTQAPPPPS